MSCRVCFVIFCQRIFIYVRLTFWISEFWSFSGLFHIHIKANCVRVHWISPLTMCGLLGRETWCVYLGAKAANLWRDFVLAIGELLFYRRITYWTSQKICKFGHVVEILRIWNEKVVSPRLVDFNQFPPDRSVVSNYCQRHMNESPFLVKFSRFCCSLLCPSTLELKS